MSEGLAEQHNAPVMYVPVDTAREIAPPVVFENPDGNFGEKDFRPARFRNIPEEEQTPSPKGLSVPAFVASNSDLIPSLESLDPLSTEAIVSAEEGSTKPKESESGSPTSFSPPTVAGPS